MLELHTQVKNRIKKHLGLIHSTIIVRRDDIIVWGLSDKTNFIKEMDEQSSKLPNLHLQLGHQLNNRHSLFINKYVIYSDYDESNPKNYSISVGLESIYFLKTNKVRAIGIFSGKYLMISVVGNSRDAINETWLEIGLYFSDIFCEHERAYKSDFEEHKSNGEIDIYISIK